MRVRRILLGLFFAAASAGCYGYGYVPVSGQVVETNHSIVTDPAIVNSDPMGNGWFFKLKIADRSEIDSLMDENAYKTLLG